MKISLNAEELCTALMQFGFNRWRSGIQISQITGCEKKKKESPVLPSCVVSK